MADVKVTREPGDDRLMQPAQGVEPVSPDVHMRWTRDTPARIRAREQEGYVMATEEDVNSNHDGWKEPDGTIRKGDLKLMKVDRVRFEDRIREHDRERAEHEQRNVRAADVEVEQAGGYDTGENYQRRGRGGKFISHS